MGLQDQWIKQIITQAKLNNMTVIGGLSAYLAALTNKQKGEIIVAYETSGAFTQWHLYVWDGASSWVDLTLPYHNHSGGSDSATLLEIYNANVGIYFYNEQLISTVWQSLVSGTGASYGIVDASSKLVHRHQTGTTTAGFSTTYLGGIKINFDDSMQYTGVIQLSAITNVAFLYGVNVEAINVAPNNLAKMGVEWCDSQPTTNFFNCSASGSARSSSDSTKALSTSERGVTIVHTPGSSLQFNYESGITVLKATNIPAGGTPYNSVLRRGIKNNNAGASNRIFDTLGSRLTGFRSGGVWVIPGE